MGKRALVVDDSKSARFALKRMLNTLKLEVDTVESAADAISYLQDHLPDVIFMDHMMPGMDGFEAVKRIKKNPQTAIIPIMMYTSKGGDVYLSQARALGAVGIIRKTIAPVELKTSLLELGIIEDIPYQSTLEIDRVKENGINASPASAHKENTLDTYIKDLHRLIDDQTIELHRSMWLGIESASNEIFNRLNSDFEEKIEKMKVEISEKNIRNKPSFTNKIFQPAYLLSILLLLSLTYNFMLMTDSEKPAIDKNNVSDEIAEVALDNVKSEIAIVNTTANTAEDIKLQKKFMQWASNKIIEYPHNEIALNDKRLPNIEELIQRAVDAKFKGRIILQTHAGDFCLIIDQLGNYKLADEKLSIENCEFIGNYMQPNDAATSHQSLSFVNFLSDTELLDQQGIAIEVMSLTRKIELSKYPERDPKTTVNKWNQAAQLNNRITVMLEPDAVDL